MSRLIVKQWLLCHQSTKKLYILLKYYILKLIMRSKGRLPSAITAWWMKGCLVSTRLQTERVNLSSHWSNNRLSTTSGLVTSINKQFILQLQALRMDSNYACSKHDMREQRAQLSPAAASGLFHLHFIYKSDLWLFAWCLHLNCSIRT